MARYRLILHKQAAKFLRALPLRVQERVRAKLDTLVEAPYGTGGLDVRPMLGEEGLWRLRVGSIRVIYEVQDERLVIYVLTMGNRGDVYKKRG